MLDKLLGLFAGPPPQTEERRVLIRQTFQALVEVDGIPAAVGDLSPHGLRLDLKSPLKPGTTVAVGPKDSRPVQCKVMWSRPVPKSHNYSAGLQFLSSNEELANSWLKEALLKAGFGSGPIRQRRKHLRIRAGLRMTLANRAGDTLADGILLNLGLGGALVALNVEFKPETRVRTQITPIGGLKALDLPSVIRSCRKRDKYLLGIAFEDQDDPLVKKYLGILLKQHGKS